MVDVINAFKVLWFEDENCENYVNVYKNDREETAKIIQENKSHDLFEIIEKGIKEEARGETFKLLESEEPLEIINKRIIPALDQVGDRYEKGIYFFPN